MRFCFTALLSLATILCSYSQKQRDSQLGIGLGYESHGINSELISPYNHTGGGIPLQLSYRSDNQTTRGHIQFNYSAFNLSSISGGVNTQEEMGILQTGYHWKFMEPGKDFSLFAGVVVDGQVSLRKNTRYGNSSTGNNSMGEIFATLNPSILGEKNLKQGKVTAQLWFSVLAYLNQPAWSSGYVEKGLTSFGNFSKYNARVSYVRYMSPRYDLRVDGQFQYYSKSEYELYRSYSLQAVVSLVYKFHPHEKE